MSLYDFVKDPVLRDKLGAPVWALDAIAKGSGVVLDLPNEQYHSTKALVSKSACDDIAVSLKLWRYNVDQPQQPPTEPMVVGDAFHVYTLEPDLFAERFVELPDFGKMQSCINRAERDDYIAKMARRGIKTLLRAQLELVMAMGDSVRAHPAARKLLKNGRGEVTTVWKDPDTGLYSKSRIDWLSELGGRIVPVDLKSAADASPEGFAKACANERYNVQDALYSRALDECGFNPEPFAFIACEKKPPYNVGVYTLDVDAKLAGERAYINEFRMLREALEINRFPSYNADKPKELRLPHWATKDADAPVHNAF